MAKKAAADEPAPGVNPSAVAGTTTLPKLEDLLWMRDKFAGGLLNLETGVRELRIAYLNHFNSLLPENHPSRLEPTFLFNAGNAFTDAAMPSGLGAGLAAGLVSGAPGSNQKRKRKPHDPNAPKRALTSYFLFMQSNKPDIKANNPLWTAQQVSEESEKRWAHISADEKKRYEYMYNVDLARYYKQKEEYDAGRPIPEIVPDEAQRLYEEHLKTGTLIKGRKGRKVIETAVAAGEITPAAAALPPVVQDDSEEDEAVESKPELIEEDAEADEDDDEDDDEEEQPPPQAKKAKTAKGSAAKVTPNKTSPEKKKVRGKKTADESDNSIAEDSTDKKNAKKPASRKRKSGKSE